jgi:hypothetical protein
MRGEKVRGQRVVATFRIDVDHTASRVLRLRVLDLRRDDQGVTELSLPGQPLSVELGDHPGFHSTAEKLVQLV